MDAAHVVGTEMDSSNEAWREQKMSEVLMCDSSTVFCEATS